MDEICPFSLGEASFDDRALVTGVISFIVATTIFLY
jgi:hypothetical protein